MGASPQAIDDGGLQEVLARANGARRRLPRTETGDAPLEIVLELLFGASRRLAVYGSLKPGESNHRVVSRLAGTWHEGYVRGEWSGTGWGSAIGFPAIHWRPTGEQVAVRLLVSDQLPESWERLDRFEGGEYCRILVPVYDDTGLLAVANLYEARGGPASEKRRP